MKIELGGEGGGASRGKHMDSNRESDRNEQS